MIQVKLKKSPAAVFKSLKKTGVASESNNTLYSSVVLIKDHLGQWQLAHFKELLNLQNESLDDLTDEMTDEDIKRLANIALLLEGHGMFDIISDQPLSFSKDIKVRILKNCDLIENGGTWKTQQKFTVSSQKMEKIHSIMKNMGI
jgi:hypothetical protein